MTDKDPNALTSWSEIIRKQGENHRERENELAEEFETKAALTIASVPALSNEGLVNLYDEFQDTGGNPRINNARAEVRKAFKAEILKRMNK